MIEAMIWGSVLICIMLLVRAYIFDRIEKRHLVWLWMVVCVRFLVITGGPVSLTLPVELPAESEKNEAQAAPVVIIREVDNEPGSLPQFDDHLNTEKKASAPVDNKKPESEYNNSVAQVSVKTDIFSILQVIYLIGAGVVLLFFVAMYTVSCFRTKRMISVSEPELLKIIDDFKLKRKVKCMWDDRNLSPYTYGLFRPKVILPLNLTELDEDKIRYIITHEMIHVRKMDYLKKTILITVAVLYWFDPLVWIMCRLANRDIEYDCDERVVEMLGGECRKAYASTILLMLVRGNRKFLSGNGFSKWNDKERIEVIVKGGERKKYKVVLFAAALSLLVLTGYLFSLKVAADENRAVQSDKKNNTSLDDVTISESETEPAAETTEYIGTSESESDTPERESTEGSIQETEREPITLPDITEYNDPRILPCMTFIDWFKEGAEISDGIYNKEYPVAFVPVVSIPVYEDMSLESVKSEMGIDDVCYVNASDGNNWVHIHTVSGKEGWIYVKAASECNRDEYAAWTLERNFAPEYSVFTEDGLVPLYDAFVYDHDGVDSVYVNGFTDVSGTDGISALLGEENVYMETFKDIAGIKEFLERNGAVEIADKKLKEMEAYIGGDAGKYYARDYQIIIFKTALECTFARFIGDDVNGRLVIIPYGEASGQEKTYLCIAKNYLRSEGYEQAFPAGV
ncbi:MAG: M56 family metallopeptidase [Lachnospiraceae bacterium]|nr:M56 family metallopeptidase [Lachnospiraceae bacterium]